MNDRVLVDLGNEWTIELVQRAGGWTIELASQDAGYVLIHSGPPAGIAGTLFASVEEAVRAGRDWLSRDWPADDLLHAAVA